MKNKRMRKLTKILSLLLVLSVLSLTATPATARYTNITSFAVSFSMSSSGLASCYTTIKLSNSTDSVDLTMELQQKNGSSWSTIKTWTTTGSKTVSLDKSWFVTSGYTYRIYVTADVSDSSGSAEETATLNSSTVSY